LIAKPINEVSDLLWHALTDHVVVHGPQLLPDPRLDFASEADFAFATMCRRPAPYRFRGRAVEG
jgi:hypothetical protein